MNRPLSIAFFIVGIILIGYGINASDSVGSGVSRAVTGAPTDRTIWLLAVGIVVGIVGLFGLFRGGSRAP